MAAQSNDKDNFKHVFEPAVKDALLDHHAENGDFICLRRWTANRAWELYRALPPSEGPVAPMTRNQLSDLAQRRRDPFVIAQEPRTVVCEEEQARTALVGGLLLMELRRCAAAGEPLPATLDELRPPVAKLVSSRREWFHWETLSRTPQLSILHPYGARPRIQWPVLTASQLDP